MIDKTALNSIEKEDLAAKSLGREPFWVRRYKLGRDNHGGECEAELRVYKLMSNSEGQELRIEKRGLRNGKPVAAQVIHLKESDIKGILAMYEELKDGR
ncbi:hypothetical protein LCGC14_2131720 [marine sediment metagenome]|uniref:Uncharacterized protein n=1 Tax=marine sediment metagenome TaxID=412755 RepID=A0A0F9E198_9ZZZZ